MVSLLFQLLIGLSVLSTLIFYATLYIGSQYEEIVSNEGGQSPSIQDVYPEPNYATQYARSS